MSRTLVKTDARGWFLDATNPDGGKVRKAEGDQIFENIVEAQSALGTLEQARDSAGSDGGAKSNGASAKPERPEPQSTVAETGKILVGKTLTIKCAWIEGAKNDGTPYETIKLANGTTIKGLSPAQRQKACGKERTIKPQDLFQARYCVEHQKAHRREIRSTKQRARTVARREARGSAK